MPTQGLLVFMCAVFKGTGDKTQLWPLLSWGHKSQQHLGHDTNVRVCVFISACVRQIYSRTTPCSEIFYFYSSVPGLRSSPRAVPRLNNNVLFDPRLIPDTFIYGALKQLV